ncbi:MAG: DUF4148 domain-containing protein [Glaciimonas sp.]|nr:DUF4148 domain-containing protein [Glaciimonas sp.]
MKSRQWIAAVIAVSGIATVGSAIADYTGRFDGPVATSSKSRAEVRSELEQARAAGWSIMQGDTDAKREWTRPNMDAHGVAGSRYSGRTRAEIRAEAIEHTKKFRSGNDAMYGR